MKIFDSGRELGVNIPGGVYVRIVEIEDDPADVLETVVGGGQVGDLVTDRPDDPGVRSVGVHSDDRVSVLFAVAGGDDL